MQGAATSIYLASSSEVDGVTGTYFANGRPRTANKASYDIAAAARLWQVSARLVGLGDASVWQVGQGASVRYRHAPGEVVQVGIGN